MIYTINFRPHELMSNNYCGPSRVIPLNLIRNEDGFRFIGIDRNGGEHYCIVRKGDSGSFYMSSNTVTFEELIGWLPDVQAQNSTATACEDGPGEEDGLWAEGWHERSKGTASIVNASAAEEK
jgi:hypothetical protein